MYIIIIGFTFCLSFYLIIKGTDNNKRNTEYKPKRNTTTIQIKIKD